MEPQEGQAPGPPTPVNVSTKLERVAKLAKQAPRMAMRSLAHHVDMEFLREAWRRTRKDAAAGVDGQTAADYERDLEGNLRSLLDRFKSGTYRAPPVRRVNVPKGDGRMRPLGVPTFEDKLLQRAVAMLLESVYEQDFLPCSYGFRPGRSAHQALEDLWKKLMNADGGWVLDVDIQAFFDSLDHDHLRSFLDQRVTDGVLRRTIGKWLTAGVLEDGNLKRTEKGTPQGGVISPLLANIYLHEVLDKWFEHEVRPLLKGGASLIRYADDFVIVFQRERDAIRVLEVLPKRLGRYGLTLHPTKTRLVRFTKPAGPDREDEEPPEDGSFDLLGFTHYWGKSRTGGWTVTRKTAASRFRRAVKAVTQWCHDHRHWPVRSQHEQLAWKLRGHAQYYGITGNSRALGRFRSAVLKAWWAGLARRSQRGLPWLRYLALLEQYPLPSVRVVHSVYTPTAMGIR